MQNRLVLEDVPFSVACLPNAANALRDLVEDHGCWVDRFAFLPPEKDMTNSVVVLELHIENVRDRAVKSLDNLSIVFNVNGIGEILWSGHQNSKDSLYGETCNEVTGDEGHMQSFQIRSFPANSEQSKKLIELCPKINSELADVAWEQKMEKQLLKLPCDIELIVRRSVVPGGTGTNPWRGGVILATQICIWSSIERIDAQPQEMFDIDFRSLFERQTVLELGAGSTALPTLALAKIFINSERSVDLISSDGVDEIVNAQKRNISENQLDDFIRVKQIDWNDHSTYCLLGEDEGALKADTIIFSDCVYNEEGATALCNAICSVLRRGGHVVGVMPDFRVGINLFEKMMKENHFISTVIPLLGAEIIRSNMNDFACSGGGGKDYRLLLWKDFR